MKNAIAELELRLETLEHNGGIYRHEGEVDRADYCDAAASEIRHAIAILRAVDDANKA